MKDKELRVKFENHQNSNCQKINHTFQSISNVEDKIYMLVDHLGLEFKRPSTRTVLVKKKSGK